MKLRAVIERITYLSAENGYSILKADVKGYKDLVTLVGNMPEETVGTVIVIIPIHFTNYVMLLRNLIYTAVIRAKKVCIVIGARKALWYAVNHVTVTQRNTKLKERLQGKVISINAYQKQEEETGLDMAAEEKPNK